MLNAIFPEDDQKHEALEIVDALLNLLYLIRLDASEPAQVAAYAAQSETLLLQIHHLISGRGNGNATTAVSAGKRKVLVIDDDPAVAKTLGLVFSSAGYESREVGSAEQALALLKTDRWIPQLAVIDVHLPGMNGLDLAVLLKAQYPELRMTLFSGRAETTQLVEEALRKGHLFHVLPKPAHPTVFLGMASRLLGDADHSTDPVQ